MSSYRTQIPLIAAFVALCCFAARVWGQAQGPISAPPKYEMKKIPEKAEGPAPAIPVDEIIRRFTANEDAAKKAYEHYSFTQTVRIQELANPGGEFTASGESYTKPDGFRYERMTHPPVSTLKRIDFNMQDVQTLTGMPAFILTTDELPHYTLTYLGKEKLDELNTFIFRVQPKQVERTRKFFDGVVWVDDQDFAVVKSSGRYISEIADNDSSTALPFRMFDTYRENIEGKYWFPTYVASDDYMRIPKQDDVHLRLVVRSTDFKLEPPPNAQPNASASPQPSSSKPRH